MEQARSTNGSGTRNLTRPILVRFTEEEFGELATLAAEEDRPLAYVIRRATLHHLTMWAAGNSFEREGIPHSTRTTRKLKAREAATK